MLECCICYSGCCPIPSSMPPYAATVSTTASSVPYHSRVAERTCFLRRDMTSGFWRVSAGLWLISCGFASPTWPYSRWDRSYTSSFTPASSWAFSTSCCITRDVRTASTRNARSIQVTALDQRSLFSSCASHFETADSWGLQPTQPCQSRTGCRHQNYPMPIIFRASVTSKCGLISYLKPGTPKNIA